MNIANTPPLTVRRDPLATIAYVSVILATLGYGLETAWQHLAAAAASATKGARAGEVEMSSYTNAHSAHFTFTNLNGFPAEACVRGVVRPKGKAGPTAESAPVCTGELKPRTTVVLEAPYRVGAVESLCSGEPDRFGNTRLDWSRCEFTTDSVAGK